MPRRDAGQRRVAAYHEAGHAIVGYVLGFRVMALLDTGHPGAGWCSSEPRKRRVDRAETVDARVDRHVATFMAGAIGEQRFTGHRLPPHAFVRDFLNAVNLMGGIERGRVPPAILERGKRGFDRASDIIDARWVAVETLAARLLRHDVVESPDVGRIIDRALSRRAESSASRFAS
jgi:hypothetical protein